VTGKALALAVLREPLLVTDKTLALPSSVNLCL